MFEQLAEHAFDLIDSVGGVDPSVNKKGAPALSTVLAEALQAPVRSSIAIVEAS